MRVLQPNRYMEAFGIIQRKYEKEDCRKTLESILTKRQEKEVITKLFYPVIEMMDACEDISLNPDNPLYLRCSSLEETGERDSIFAEIFFTYYRGENREKPSRVIEKAFAQDGGKEFIENIVCSGEKLRESPVLAVLHSGWKAEDQVILLRILEEGEPWIQEFSLLLEQIADRIDPILEKYKDQYTYLDELMKKEDAQEIILRRMRLNPLEEVAVQPVISTCNMGYIRGKEKEKGIEVMIHIGTLHCAMDFSEPGEFTREQLQEHLKCLSDPTKLSILMILKEKPTYQTDLARQLGLTTATISHHMNQLLVNGFVKHRLEEKKVYYEYQRDMVEYTCMQVKKML